MDTPFGRELDQLYIMTPIRQYELDGVTHSGYGITWQSGESSTTIEDISCNEEVVSTMAHLFSLCELPPTRLIEVISACLP